jgi:hypothetical protein
LRVWENGDQIRVGDDRDSGQTKGEFEIEFMDEESRKQRVAGFL